ncbi:MAG: hypothetical protein AVDCRST_MAG13-2664, partial [uncultured Solirubrobacteraceae bacterium]
GGDGTCGRRRAGALERALRAGCGPRGPRAVGLAGRPPRAARGLPARTRARHRLRHGPQRPLPRGPRVRGRRDRHLRRGGRGHPQAGGRARGAGPCGARRRGDGSVPGAALRGHREPELPRARALRPDRAGARARRAARLRDLRPRPARRPGQLAGPPAHARPERAAAGLRRPAGAALPRHGRARGPHARRRVPRRAPRVPGRAA